MLSVEADQFIKQQVIERWPRWKPTSIERGDWRRVLSRIDYNTAVEAIARTKENTKLVMMPVLGEFQTKIGEVVGEQKREKNLEDPPTPFRGWVACYALNEETGKSHECYVPEHSPDGPRIAFALWLKKYDLEPTDYTLFVGQENFDQFFHKRHEVFCKINPNIRDRTELLRKTGARFWEKI